MKCNESPSEAGPQTKSPRRQKYTKVLDHRKHPLRGLWRRNGSFVARISVEDTTGPKSVRWVPLAAKSVAGAQDEVRKLLVSSGQRQPGSNSTAAIQTSLTGIFKPRLLQVVKDLRINHRGGGKDVVSQPRITDLKLSSFARFKPTVGNFVLRESRQSNMMTLLAMENKFLSHQTRQALKHSRSSLETLRRAAHPLLAATETTA